MKSLMEAAYEILDTEAGQEFDIYPVKRPATDPSFPYIVFNVECSDLNAVMYEFTVTLDIYDRQLSAVKVLTAVEDIMKAFDRVCISTDAVAAFGRFTSSGWIPEDDREVWHWSADFSVRADKKAIIGGK